MKINKTSDVQPTQTIEIPGGRGDTFEIDLLHEDEWAEEIVTHMDKGFNSWEDAGTHLFSGDNMWSSAPSGDDDFVSTIAFHNIDGISCDAGINESLLDHLRCNSSILCIGDTKTDARNASRKIEVPCLAKLGTGLKRIDRLTAGLKTKICELILKLAKQPLLFDRTLRHGPTTRFPTAARLAGTAPLSSAANLIKPPTPKSQRYCSLHYICSDIQHWREVGLGRAREIHR